MFWSASERLGNFPLSGGRFADTWSDTERYSDGSTETYEWNIAGRVTTTSAKGTIALTSTFTEATGEAMGFRMAATKFTAATGSAGELAREPLHAARAARGRPLPVTNTSGRGSTP